MNKRQFDKVMKDHPDLLERHARYLKPGTRQVGAMRAAILKMVDVRVIRAKKLEDRANCPYRYPPDYPRSAG